MGKHILVTGPEAPYACESLRTSGFLDNRHADDREVVSHTRQPPVFAFLICYIRSHACPLDCQSHHLVSGIPTFLAISKILFACKDRLCGLVVRVPDCSPIGPEFDSRRYQIFWAAVSLERGPLSPCEDKWAATGKKSNGSDVENWD
jgi:hypothetical protein